MDGFLIACIFVFYAALLVSPTLRMWISGDRRDDSQDPPDQPLDAWLDDVFPDDEFPDEAGGKPAA